VALGLVQLRIGDLLEQLHVHILLREVEFNSWSVNCSLQFLEVEQGVRVAIPPLFLYKDILGNHPFRLSKYNSQQITPTINTQIS
jgi:hypothetical protein